MTYMRDMRDWSFSNPSQWSHEWVVQEAQRLCKAHGFPSGTTHPSTRSFLCRVLVARRRWYKKKEHREIVLRAFAVMLRDDVELAAAQAVDRLDGLRGLGKHVGKIGAKPRILLTEEERRARIKAGRSARTKKLAARAAWHLADAEEKLADAEEKLAAAKKAVVRAESLVRKWATKVRYHRDEGHIP